MEKKHHRYGFVFVLCIIISLDLVSFISCLIAEAKKAKVNEYCFFFFSLSHCLFCYVVLPICFSPFDCVSVQRKDLKLDGKLCYLPESHAHELGIAALICLGVAQVIGNLLICRIFCTRDKRNNCKTQKLRIATALLVLSWRCHEYEQEAAIWQRLVGPRVLFGQRWRVRWLRRFGLGKLGFDCGCSHCE
ncbi:uncharacterized protein LOC18038539 isoform X2 [Citrus clementina]|uniref:uncharacterized protein LOC18038539 isoform X2 n=1 Tax=Citrus clementina TaxID=85681 RepID=UPI000CED3F95|nr:uncharacterized protein LOC18038539 isoform X2 [Citrus x clementina]